MTKKRSTKHAFWMSALSLLLCVSMLIGTTYAWFTDEVVSGMNTIMAGNLDVELLADGKKVTAETKLFDDVALWEPGVVVYENLQVVNEGSLALTYQMTLNFADENDLEGHKLSEVLKVAVIDKIADGADRATVLEAAKKAANVGSLYDFFVAGELEAKSSATEQTVVIFWEASTPEIDNLYNATGGKTTSNGEPLQIEFGVTLVAAQMMSESDSFGFDYDANAVFPNFSGKFYAEAEVADKVDANNQLTENLTVGKVGGRMYATVPAGTLLAPGTTKLTLVVDTTERSGNIEMTQGQVSRSLDVHVDGIDENNTTPIAVELGAVMPTGYKDSSIRIFHVENGTPVQMVAVDALSAHNQFTYNADTGALSVNMASFSEVTAVVSVGDPWDGKLRDVAWYNTTDTEFTIDTAEEFAGFSAIVGGMAAGIEQDDFKGKTVKLGSDINLGGTNGNVWYPVGYHNDLKSYDRQTGAKVTSNVSSFEGTFDGQNYAISNIYQNTWGMFGDYNDGYSGTPNYYKDGMGIFGFVFNGTIKNLIVNNFQSDGEFATTGCVAAYASGASNFENITIINSNPRAYNVPNGGVVGYAYAEDGATNVINFNKVNVESSNKITALWGSWDVGCGGILGRVNGATTVNMEDCTVAAEIDVYNDVCGNYQYYQYRYAGMLIGTVGPDGDPKSGPETVNFSNVKVYIGNWADYYYCEFEKNSQGSYTDDFQFSRVEKNEINFDPNTNLPYTSNLSPCRHVHQGTEDKMGVYLPFEQIYTGYGWGASPVKAADGVEVIKYFYAVIYKNSDGSQALRVDYVTNGERSETKLWADAFTVKSDSVSKPADGQQFNGWRNSDSVAVSTIQAGNRNDVILYESWTNPFMARFVDFEGNVIYSQPFKAGATSISEPAVPHMEGYVGKWEEYQSRIDALSGDVTIHPIYTPQEGQGAEDLVIGDSSLTAKKLFEYLSQGKSVVMNGDIVGDGSDFSLSGNTHNFCEIQNTESYLNLNTFELTCNFNHNANKSWHVIDINSNGKLTVSGGLNREGLFKMTLKDVKSPCYVFALDPSSTLVLEAGVTIEVNYPTNSSASVYGFGYFDSKGNLVKTDDLANYDGIYVDRTTNGVLRIVVGVTTTITSAGIN